jgi:hypothetical protein
MFDSRDFTTAVFSGGTADFRDAESSGSDIDFGGDASFPAAGSLLRRQGRLQ